MDVSSDSAFTREKRGRPKSIQTTAGLSSINLSFNQNDFELKKILLDVRDNESEYISGFLQECTSKCKGHLTEIWWEYDCSKKGIDIYKKRKSRRAERRPISNPIQFFKNFPINLNIWDVQGVKAEGDFKFEGSFDSVWDLFQLSANVKNWDPLCVESKDYERIVYDNGNTVIKVSYLRYKTPSIVGSASDRDFCVCTIMKRLDQNSMVLISNSVPYSKCPKQKRIVRGELRNSGYWIRKIGLHTYRETFITEIDHKGSLPSWLVNMFSVKQSVHVASMRKYLERELEKYNIPVSCNF